MRIGVDVDGVLARFTRAYVKLIKQRTGKDVPEDATTWNWATELHGVTKTEDREAWQWIKANGWWWGTFEPYEPEENGLLLRAWERAADLYFITSRPGEHVQRTTALWLKEHFVLGTPTVLIAPHPDDKKHLVQGLDLTHFVDDKFETVLDVRASYGKCRTMLMNRSWNEGLGHDAWRINRLDDLVPVEIPA